MRWPRAGRRRRPLRDSLPGWAEDDVDVSVEGGRVTVRLRPPSPLRALADRLAVTSSAVARSKMTLAGPVVLVTAVGAASRFRAAGRRGARLRRPRSPTAPALLIDLSGPGAAPVAGRHRRRASLEERLAAHLPAAGVASRGSALPSQAPGRPNGSTALPLRYRSFATRPASSTCRRASCGRCSTSRASSRSASLLRADLAADRALTALAASDLIGATFESPWSRGRWAGSSARALIGVLPGGGFPARLRERLLAGDPAPRL